VWWVCLLEVILLSLSVCLFVAYFPSELRPVGGGSIISCFAVMFFAQSLSHSQPFAAIRSHS
jgi:hypothetical protein